MPEKCILEAFGTGVPNGHVTVNIKFDPGNVAISFMAGQDDKISDFVSYRCKYFQYFSKKSSVWSC